MAYTEELNEDVLEIEDSPFNRRTILGSIARRSVFDVRTVDGTDLKLVIAAIYVEPDLGKRMLQCIDMSEEFLENDYIPDIILDTSNISFMRSSDVRVYDMSISKDQASSIMHRTDKIAKYAKNVIFGPDSE